MRRAWCDFSILWFHSSTRFEKLFEYENWIYRAHFLYICIQMLVMQYIFSRILFVAVGYLENIKICIKFVVNSNWLANDDWNMQDLW